MQIIQNEKQGAEQLCDKISQWLTESGRQEYEVKTGYNLCYRAEVVGYDENGVAIFEELTGKKCKYQTDICILRKENKANKAIWVPEIVIETKFKSYTTHDIITYSEKALTHKKLHPNLKYGLVVMNPTDKQLYSRFFVHNFGFDFALLLELDDETSLTLLRNMIKEIITNSSCAQKPKIRGFVNLTETYPIIS